MVELHKVDFIEKWLKSIGLHHRPLIQVRIPRLILKQTEFDVQIPDCLKSESSTIQSVGPNLLSLTITCTTLVWLNKLKNECVIDEIFVCCTSFWQSRHPDLPHF